MTLQKLKSLGNYKDINAGAHRKPASVVGIPSLVRNLGFWNTGFKVPKTDSADPRPEVAVNRVKSEGRSEDERSGDYREYVRKLWNHIESGSKILVPVSTTGDRGLAWNPRGESGTVTLHSFRWRGIWATVRIEFHTEYVTLASILDLSIEVPPDAADPDGDDVSFKQVRSKIERLKELFEQPIDERSDRTDEHASISAYLQKNVWEAFEREVIDVTIGCEPILENAFGEVFLDSRGIVIGADEVDRGAAPAKSADETPYKKLREPFRYPQPRKRTDTAVVNTRPKRKWARDTLPRIWPFVEAEGQAGYEFTVSGFLGGQVLFITALGPQPAPSESDDPIFYFLFAYADDDWQLGRLVDRINSLGTLRLAATMEIVHLREAGAKMDELARAIEKAARSVQSEIKGMKRGQEGGEGDATETVDALAKTGPVGAIHGINVPAPLPLPGETGGVEGAPGERSAVEILDTPGKMAQVGDLHKQINKSATKDIWDRLERSQYYLKQFREDCGALRERRVEGFQTYSEFVTRRMSSIFGYIQFLRTRMESLDVANSSLERQYSWLKITDVTGKIGLVVGEMNNQNREIEKIQYVGELALIGVLIPYYFGTILFEHVYHPPEEESGTSWGWLLTAFVVLAIVRTLWVWFKSRKGDSYKTIRNRSVSVLLVSALYLLFIWQYVAKGPAIFEPIRALIAA